MDELVKMAMWYVVDLCDALGQPFRFSGILKALIVEETKDRRFGEQIPEAIQELVRLNILEDRSTKEGERIYPVLANWDNRLAILGKRD